MIFTSDPFDYQRIAADARTMRTLGMTFCAIGGALGVDEKTVRKALGRACPPSASSPKKN